MRRRDSSPPGRSETGGEPRLQRGWRGPPGEGAKKMAMPPPRNIGDSPPAPRDPGGAPGTHGAGGAPLWKRQIKWPWPPPEKIGAGACILPAIMVYYKN